MLPVERVEGFLGVLSTPLHPKASGHYFWAHLQTYLFTRNMHLTKKQVVLIIAGEIAAITVAFALGAALATLLFTDVNLTTL